MQHPLKHMFTVHLRYRPARTVMTYGKKGVRMKRSELREQIFKMLFRTEFYEESELPQQLALFFEELEKRRIRIIFRRNSRPLCPA